jgi:hypothetical protein
MALSQLQSRDTVPLNEEIEIKRKDNFLFKKRVICIASSCVQMHSVLNYAIPV